MKWFRSNNKQGVRLALFALAIQVLLSFGHYHRLGVSAAEAVQSGLSQIDLVTDANGLLEKVARPQLPASDDHDRQPGDICAICAVISLASGSIFAAPPLLVLPQATEFSYLPTAAEVVNSKSAGVAFQPRAPPAP
jgi:hypothetical protein